MHTQQYLLYDVAVYSLGIAVGAAFLVERFAARHMTPMMQRVGSAVPIKVTSYLLHV